MLQFYSTITEFGKVVLIKLTMRKKNVECDHKDVQHFGKEVTLYWRRLNATIYIEGLQDLNET